MSGMFDVMDDSNENATAMGQAFDAAHNDDSFYLPPEVFQNPDFQRAMSSFLSPDGKAARFIISHKGDPGSPEGIASIDQIRAAAEEALKTTPLQGASIHIAGASSTFQDLRDGSKYYLYIAAISALCLIFIIMLMMTRSIIAALVIVGTVALSLGASFGLSVLIWQYVLGITLHWMVLPMSVIILLAVGSDYRSGRYHHRPGPAVRHLGRALIHDTVYRRAARTLVLVATNGSSAPGQSNASGYPTASRGTGLAATGRGPRRRGHNRTPKVLRPLSRCRFDDAER